MNGGNGAFLWPRGCQTIEDVPNDLIKAVQHAFRVMNWHENLPGDEIPPAWMWPFDELLDDWFEQVEADRKAKWDNPGSQDEEADMMDNEYADRFK